MKPSSSTSSGINKNVRAKRVQKKSDGREASGENLVETGTGFFVFASGSTYEGDFHRYVDEVRRQGRGVFSCAEYTVNGFWHDNALNGLGTVTFVSGAKYEGEFTNGLFGPNGKYTFENGAVYEGGFEANRIHGDGTFTAADGTKFSGAYANNFGPGLATPFTISQVHKNEPLSSGELQENMIEINPEDGYNMLTFFCNAAFKIKGKNVVIYIDPFHLPRSKPKLKKVPSALKASLAEMSRPTSQTDERKSEDESKVVSEGESKPEEIQESVQENSSDNENENEVTLEKADIILLTHTHRDHYSPDDIDLISKPETMIVVSKDFEDKMKYGMKMLENGESGTFFGVLVEAVPAYNIEKHFHPKSKGNGYLITIDGFRFYHTGDSENIPEMKSFGDIDIALVNLGAPYCMTIADAIEATIVLHPTFVTPMHYGDVNGTDNDGKEFASAFAQMQTQTQTQVRVLEKVSPKLGIHSQ